jgi:hypothetical protein
MFFFIVGYFVKSVVFFHYQKKANENLQERAQRGEYMPIVMQFDLNGMGGYTLGLFNMRGVHLIKENHDKFLMILKDFLENEKKRLHGKPGFKLLNFKRDE